MNNREIAKQYRFNKWTEIIRECRSSGQTISSWCADHDMNPKTYYYWLKRIRTAACEALPSLGSPNNPIVPITITAPTSGINSTVQEVMPDMIIRFGAVTLEIRNHASAALIENTLRALQNVR